MTIDSIKITNFKNFSNISVDFAPGVNLFVGSNGSGKTSILEAINVAVGGFFSLQEQKLQRMIDFDEIRISNRVRQPSTTIEAKSNTLNIKWTRSIKSTTKANDSKGTKDIGTYGKHIFLSFDLPDTKVIAPLIAYYSTQRLFKDATMTSKQRYDAAAGRRNGYLQALKSNAIKGVLNDWLGNAVTRRGNMMHHGIPKVDQVLENVEAAIRQTLRDFLNLPEQADLKIYQDPDFENEIFVFLGNELDLPLSYFSDGFRNLVYLVFDMVWRASQLNPGLTLEEITEKVNGVVTIDEIDLHLHPKWQAKAIGLLQKLFPRVQFFVTTHSPTVVANFEHGTLYVINDNQIVRHENDYFGKQVNNVLRNILGAADRHVPTQEKLNELFKLIDNNEADNYQPLLESLIIQLGQEDSDIQKAIALIAMQEMSKEKE
jgi:predicted ATP-binding protein involved in virulence